MTPAQASLWMAQIGRRRRERALEQVGLLRAAMWANEEQMTALAAQLAAEEDRPPEQLGPPGATPGELAMIGIRVQTTEQDNNG